MLLAAISGFGITMKRRCHRAAAATARRGKRFSTQASLKKLLERNFRDSKERFERAGQTAGKTLAKRAPAYFELWFARAGQMHRRRGGIGLSQEVERIAGLNS